MSDEQSRVVVMVQASCEWKDGFVSDAALRMLINYFVGVHANLVSQIFRQVLGKKREKA